MRRIFLLVAIVTSLCSVSMRAQDAAVVERLNQLSGKIEDLIASQETQRKRIEALNREVDSLREAQQNTPKTEYARPEDLKRVAKAVEEVDRKRIDDFEKIRDEIGKLGKKLTAAPSPRPPKDRTADDSPKEKDPEKKGYEYVVKQGDTLSLIAQAYSKELNAKITVDQIIAANPGLKPERMAAGKKIFIPAPK